MQVAFSLRKASFECSQKVYMYSENAPVDLECQPRWRVAHFCFFPGGPIPMSSQGVLRAVSNQTEQAVGRPSTRTRKGPIAPPIHFPAHSVEAEASHRHAELFYLQKQIQSQTPMVIVLEDGEHIEGCIEWYDRNTLKVRGKVKALVYKSAIKYMYKVGDQL
jgi:sRNA-binding regulator protein Hfq